MIERRRYTRYPIVLPALCWSRDRKDFYAVTEDISVDGIKMKSSTVPALYEELVVDIRQIGSVGTVVMRVEERSFVVRIISRAQSVGAVARELVVLSQLQDRPRERLAFAVGSRGTGLHAAR